MADIRTVIGGLALPNPVLLASGTCGYGTELAGMTNLSGLGGIILKTVTLEPRRGNPPQRIAETPAGMLNAIGLQNVGIDALLNEKIPKLQELLGDAPVKIIINIAGETVAEYARVAEKAASCPAAAALELNISCPNLRSGGKTFGHDKTAVAAVTKTVKKAVDIPLIVKLTPNVTDIENYALTAQEAGADILSVANTWVGMLIDTRLRRPVLSNGTGGVSGPAIFPLSLAAVWKVCSAVDIPVIGIGGIASANDAVQYLLAGARAVQIGTAGFVDPDISQKVISGIGCYLEENDIDNIADLNTIDR